MEWETLTYSLIEAGKTNPTMESETFIADIQTLQICLLP